MYLADILIVTVIGLSSSLLEWEIDFFFLL